MEPTKTQLACNAIRAIFFNKAYNKHVPKKEIDFILTNDRWHKFFGKKALKDAWKQLLAEGYVTAEKEPHGEPRYIWGIENTPATEE